MAKQRRPKNWQDSELIENAAQYKSQADWRKAEPGAYSAAYRKGLLDTIVKNFIPKPTWTKDRLLEEASKYESKFQWRKANIAAHHAAHRLGIIEDCARVMKPPKEPTRPAQWTIKTLLEDAAKYETKSQWRKANPSAYTIAHQKGIFAECTAHMNSIQKG